MSCPATYVETTGANTNAQYFEIETDVDQLFCATVMVNNDLPFIQAQISIGTD
jgi:hypothetical protein